MATFALAQTDIAWENPSENIDRVNNMFAEHGPESFDAVILPELWSVGFTMNQTAHQACDQTLAAMTQLSQKLDCPIIGGVPVKVDNSQQNRCYRIHGTQQDWYAKIKTFKFAGEHHKYQSGSERRIWDVAGFKLAPYICYDLRFPELVRAAMPHANLIVYIANWPSVRVHHWHQLLVARAIENLAYVIGVNRSGSGGGLEYPGHSMLVSPAGEILLEAGPQPGLFTVDLDPDYPTQCRQKWPFLSDM